MYNVATREEAADEIDRLRADLNAAKFALENQITHTTNIANLCARQRAWIDGVMAQPTVKQVNFNAPLITRPSPFEDK